MTIVYFISSLSNSAGMERVLTTKANWLAEVAKLDVHIALTGEDMQCFFPLSEKVKLHVLDLKSKNNPKAEIENLLYKLKPDFTISLYGAEAKYLYKIKDGSKKILEFHFSRYYITRLVNGIKHLRFRFLHHLRGHLIQYRNKKLAKKYDKVVLLTRQDLNLWNNKPNMTFIPNPLSFRSEETADLSSHRIVAVGRLIAQKGFDLLINAFSQIAPDFPDWTLSIIGSGQDKELLQSMIEQYKLSDRVFIQDPTLDIQKEFLKSSIFAFPSRYEGFGLVITEAMECGLPTVAFDCECGPAEIITDKTGILVPVGDVDGLAEALRKLMADEKLRSEMGKAAKEDVSRFYADSIGQKWLDLFDQMH